jgi:hypothetical protein
MSQRSGARLVVEKLFSVGHLLLRKQDLVTWVYSQWQQYAVLDDVFIVVLLQSKDTIAKVD